MQQRRLGEPESGFHVEIEIRRCEHFRQGRRLDEGEAPRHFQDLARRHHDGFGIASAGKQGAHVVAHIDTRNAISHRFDDAGALEAENVARARRRRIVAFPLDKVGAIDGAGAIGDANVPGTRLAERLSDVRPAKPFANDLNGFHQDIRIFTPRASRCRLSPLTV